MQPPMIRLVFNGPPGSPYSQFVAAEGLDGKALSVGAWAQVGEQWHLHVALPVPAETPATPPENVIAGRFPDRLADTPELSYRFHPNTKPAGPPVHLSDCATHNAPAYAAGACDCGHAHVPD